MKHKKQNKIARLRRQKQALKWRIQELKSTTSKTPFPVIQFFEKEISNIEANIAGKKKPRKKVVNNLGFDDGEKWYIDICTVSYGYVKRTIRKKTKGQSRKKMKKQKSVTFIKSVVAQPGMINRYKDGLMGLSPKNPRIQNAQSGGIDMTQEDVLNIIGSAIEKGYSTNIELNKLLEEETFETLNFLEIILIQKWLREIHNWHVCISYRPNIKKWSAHAYSLNMSGLEYAKSRPFKAYLADLLFEKYEHALVHGVSQALKQCNDWWNEHKKK